jgi:hypothetical protein
MKVDRTGSGSCPMAGSATRVFRGTGYEDGRWIELAQDRVQWRALLLAVLNQTSRLIIITHKPQIFKPPVKVLCCACLYAAPQNLTASSCISLLDRDRGEKICGDAFTCFC